MGIIFSLIAPIDLLNAKNLLLVSISYSNWGSDNNSIKGVQKVIELMDWIDLIIVVT